MSLGKKNLLLGGLGALLLFANILLIRHPLIGVVGILFYVAGLGGLIGAFFHGLKKNERFFWGILTAVMYFILANTAIYYAYKITTITTIAVLLIPLGVLLLWKEKRKDREMLESPIPRLDHAGIPNNAILFLIIESTLFFILFKNQTTSLLPSPWQTLSPLFFVGYAAATCLLFLAIQKIKNTILSYALSTIHLFLTFSVAAIIYTLGFGFDAFIHRATEVWIQTHGFIMPKTPYYIGQYSFVVWLSNITAIPIFFIDVYLLPILAALTLPATVVFTLNRMWDIPSRHGLMLTWLIPLVPFFSFHLTTPHNLALLFAIIIVFATLQYLKGELPALILILLALAALVTHPLLGSLITLFVISTVVLKIKEQRTKNKEQNTRHVCSLLLVPCFLFLVSFIAIALALPALFTFLNYIHGFPLPGFENPLTKIPQFLDLFSRPYWYLEKSFWHLDILYAWQRLIPVSIIILGLFGFFLVKKNNQSLIPPSSGQVSGHSFLITTFLAFLASAFLLRSWIVFANVVSYEQTDFPLRILKASLIFLLPFSMYGVYKIATFLSFRLDPPASGKATGVVSLGMTILGSLLLMFSLYLSYPQRNHKSRFPGFNVTQADFDAVEWIHQKNLDRQEESSNYIVLSNQLVSAAALTQYSFLKHFQTEKGELFYYSIPTGGPLYQYYGKMLYEGQKREYMEEAMALTGTDRAYFVVNSYWGKSAEIVEGAKKTADSWQVIGDEKVWVFEYKK